MPRLWGMSLKERRRVRGEQKRQLGEGRFSTTWVFEDADSGEERVLKRISTRHLTPSDVDTLSGKPAALKVRELFEREVAVLQQLDHPGIPRYIDSYVEASPEGGVDLCLVQEKIEGEPLSDVLATRRFTEAESIALVRQVAEVLAYLHSLHPPLVHRDLKPSNIIVRPDGRIALIDFGAVVDQLAPEGGSTIVGTFGYMPLEQYEGRSAPASDVYALGMVWIEMLTGKKPSSLERKGLALDFQRYTRASDPLVSLLECMVDMDQSKRPADGTALLDEIDALHTPQRAEPVVESVLPDTTPVARRRSAGRTALGFGITFAGIMFAIVALTALVGVADGTTDWHFGWWWWIGGFFILRGIFGRRRRSRRRRRRPEAAL